MIWRVRPFLWGSFQHILIQIMTPGITWAIFIQRLSADNFPHEGSSKSEGEEGASSAFRYTITYGDARVLIYFNRFSCTLLLIARAKPLATQYVIDYSASPR